jgi:hypothetical protein
MWLTITEGFIYYNIHDPLYPWPLHPREKVALLWCPKTHPLSLSSNGNDRTEKKKLGWYCFVMCLKSIAVYKSLPGIALIRKGLIEYWLKTFPVLVDHNTLLLLLGKKIAGL